MIYFLNSIRKKSFKKKGFSLVEVILASSLFGILIMGLLTSFLYGQETTMLSGQRARATFLAEEGLEATRNIRGSDFANLSDGTYGLSVSGGEWVFSGTSDVTDIFTRTIEVSSVDVDRKQITSTVNWQQNAQRTGSVVLVTYLTNWQVASANQADSLVVDTTNSAVNAGDNTLVTGVTIQNTGLANITVDRMTVSWTGAPGGTKINGITINGGSVWSGSRNSGQELDITDFILSPSTSYPINNFDFSKNITSTIITVLFTMLDGSTKTVVFSPGVSLDLVSPAAIVDLVASNASSSTIDLAWTAPGDDGNIGTATTYDVRYSNSIITELNWLSATQVIGEPNPSVAGTSESMTVTGLSANTTYYFAIKTSDEVPNTSAISNVPSLATSGGGGGSEADSLVVNAGSVAIDPSDNKQVIGIDLQNSSGSNITLASMIISWSGIQGGAKTKAIQINGSSVWTGNGSSGNVHDIVDVIIPSAGTVPINFIRFSKNATGITLNITFTMLDGSTKVVSNISP